MRIVADENIIYAAEAFGQFGEVLCVHGRKINNHLLTSADALIVRSITGVNAGLLHGTPVAFVGTATIGTDHLDIPFLNENNIPYASAQGCNAQSVAEYIAAVIADYCHREKKEFPGISLGIIGVGNIGRKVEAIARSWGITVLLNDPPRAERERNENFVPLSDALRADIVTFHTPLTRAGKHPSYHLLNAENVNLLKPGGLLINASRGEVTATDALFAYEKNNTGTLVLDVFENEPEINSDILQHTLYASPHTAGYSVNGKINGTVMMADALAKVFGLKNTFIPPPVVPELLFPSLPGTSGPEEFLAGLFRQLTSLNEDTGNMNRIPGLPPAERGVYFDKLRKDYKLRYESKEYQLPASVFERYGKYLSAFNFAVCS